MAVMLKDSFRSPANQDEVARFSTTGAASFWFPAFSQTIKRSAAQVVQQVLPLARCLDTTRILVRPDAAARSTMLPARRKSFPPSSSPTRWWEEKAVTEKQRGARLLRAPVVTEKGDLRLLRAACYRLRIPGLPATWQLAESVESSGSHLARKSPEPAAGVQFLSRVEMR
jgi:hypothetical protein